MPVAGRGSALFDGSPPVSSEARSIRLDGPVCSASAVHIHCSLDTHPFHQLARKI
jgi:hypothetical protein